MMPAVLYAAMSTLGVLIGLAIVGAVSMLLAWLIARRRMKHELSIMEARRKRVDERWKQLEAEINARGRVPRDGQFGLEPKDPRP